MGGCYDSRYASDCYREPVRQTDPVEQLIKKFFSTQERKHLFDAYRKYGVDHNQGFIQEVVDYSGSEIKKEFGEYEIEAKLELAVAGKPNLTEIMDAFEFTPSPSSRFLKDASNLESSGVNYFFGTAAGEERFVVIEKKGKWYLKEKGPIEAYHLGIPGEEYVLKRKETRVETNPLELAKTVTGKYADGKSSYIGGLTKSRAEAHLLQTVSGRIYSLTVDELVRQDKSTLVQFEAEYAGYVAKFKTKPNDERAVVEDLVAVLKQIVFLYNDLELPGGQRLLIKPTQERKFDFVGREMVKERPLQLVGKKRE